MLVTMYPAKIIANTVQKKETQKFRLTFNASSNTNIQSPTRYVSVLDACSTDGRMIDE